MTDHESTAPDDQAGILPPLTSALLRIEQAARRAGVDMRSVTIGQQHDGRVADVLFHTWSRSRQAAEQVLDQLGAADGRVEDSFEDHTPPFGTIAVTFTPAGPEVVAFYRLEAK